VLPKSGVNVSLLLLKAKREFDEHEFNKIVEYYAKLPVEQ
jgi:hypothetical protein